MRRVTITTPEETRRAVERAARREGKSFSQTEAELIEKQLSEERKKSPFLALIGIADKELPYTAADIDEELAKTWADAICEGWGK